MIALTIDGAVVRVPEGTSLLEAARAAGAHVPTLCDSDHLSPHGACRLCVVEVAGRDPVASCHTSAVAGMVVHTQSERLLRLRRNIVELIVSDHPLDCLGCVANNRCELQAVAAELGFREVRYPPGAAHAPEPDRSHPFLAFDMDKCVACARCARVCDEVQGSFVLAMSGRGFAMGVIAGDDTGLAEAECASCGACAVECPVGAIVDTGQLDAGFPDRIRWMQAAARKYPYLDLSRVGIYGGSAGGQNALGALLFHPDFYKVAVSDCGCHDNRMDKIHWNEAWMGLMGPHYAENSNVTHAHKLQGKLFLTVGELDTNVDPASTMQVVNALIRANKDFDFLLVPGAGHGVGETPYLRRRRQDFFVRHLLGVEPREN